MIDDSEFNEYISQLITKLLQLGVPTTIVSTAFTLDISDVKQLQADLRVKQYGSPEIAELLQGLMFIAYERAKHDIIHGSPALKSRMIGLVLSKSLALVGKQAPETFDNLRHQITALFSDMKMDNVSRSIYVDDDFSPTDVEEDNGV